MSLAYLIADIVWRYLEQKDEAYLIADIVWRYLEQKDEAVRQRAQVAVLQMRPHFIHNTLMSIYFLCAQDPQKAQQVILDFSRYLQSNFTAIAQEGTIEGVSRGGTGAFSRTVVRGV